jgi:hypothetical protein
MGALSGNECLGARLFFVRNSKIKEWIPAKPRSSPSSENLKLLSLRLGVFAGEKLFVASF